jgi:hypothetical protein
LKFFLIPFWEGTLEKQKETVGKEHSETLEEVKSVPEGTQRRKKVIQDRQVLCAHTPHPSTSSAALPCYHGPP